RRHTSSYGDWSSDVCSSDLHQYGGNCSDGTSLQDRCLKENAEVSQETVPCGGDRNSYLCPTTAIRSSHFEALTASAARYSSPYQIRRASCRERVGITAVGDA